MVQVSEVWIETFLVRLTWVEKGLTTEIRFQQIRETKLKTTEYEAVKIRCKKLLVQIFAKNEISDSEKCRKCAYLRGIYYLKSLDDSLGTLMFWENH